tara:strand:- start:15147 stop:16937 length:1791 start_codon:yes stop_codon:yes gene_type:complete
MKPYWADDKVYKLYHEYLERCVLEDDSFLSDEKAIITLNSLDDCINRFVVNAIEGKDSFENKIFKQFEGASYETLLTFAHVNWLWCMAPSDFSKWFKMNVAKNILGENLKAALREDIYPDGGFGDAGPSIKFRKPKEIAFLLLLMKELKLKVKEGKVESIEDANLLVESMSMEALFNWDEETSEIVSDEVWKHIPEGKLAMYNIMMHLANPDQHEPIASDGHKKRVRYAFRAFIEESDEKVKELNPEKQLYFIRQKLSELTGKENFTFYDEEFRKIWNYTLNEEGFSEIQGLQYKKAIILYGPPGTSKTHSAKRLSKALITDHYLSKPANVKSYFEQEIDVTETRIHRLQLHNNYTYEDFVAGFQLVANETKVVKGKLFEISKAAREDDLPHVLILDEINRVDISRLFGEVFSAIEDREQDIELSIGGLSLSIPKNLYIIGTMNEIDFSLEQIDFALRRRFLWFYYGFKEDVLRNMIWSKNNPENLDTKLKADEVNQYVQNCSALNDQLKELPELGPQYEIGHTFFSEVVDIFSSYKSIHGYSKQLSKQIFREGGAIDIIWSISIEPIIEAFLGNLDKDSKKDIIKELKEIFKKSE